MIKNDIPKVAIITRTKDRPIFLERAIKSVLKQTFKDYVHVILNDGGDRKKVEAILKKYPAKNRVVIHNVNSLGGTVALNQGIRAVNTKYVSILDDDDSWEKDRLSLAVDFMEKNNSFGTVSKMNKIEEIIKDDSNVVEVSNNLWRPDITSINLYKQCLENNLSNGCFIYLRSVYDELGGYDEALEVAEDWEFGIRFLLKYDVDFIDVDGATVNYHLRPEAAGAIGNTVFAGIKKHNRDINKILNKYLRKDLINGSLGLGYIMSDLKFNHKKELLMTDINNNNLVRLEGHVNGAVEEIKKELARIDERKVSSKIKRAIKDIIK